MSKQQQDFEHESRLFRVQTIKFGVVPSPVPNDSWVLSLTSGWDPDLLMRRTILHSNILLYDHSVPLLGGHVGNIQQPFLYHLLRNIRECCKDLK